jgi:crotonobetainyl-CoA:carnitine CoA-transferase CaiB-like acyl-CoA transferase
VLGTRGTPPLAGITVLEVGAFMAAPFAAMQLADLGATILKIEQPGSGDPVRDTGPFVEGHSSPFARLNRNKHSVALDLKTPGGREALLRLAAEADVLVENLRPGAMRKLGLDFDTVHAVAPGLVYASASGWGQDGPLAALPGLDIMAQARGGLMSITGTPDGEPTKIGVPICDLVCALYVALAVTAALRERDRTRLGQHIDVSLYEAGVSFAVWEAGKYFATGEVGRPLGSAHQSTAPYQAVRTADGHVTLGAVTPKTWAALCDVLGLGALQDDPRYADAFTRQAHRETLIAEIENVTQSWASADLVRALDEAGVPCAPIADYAEVFTDEHLNQRGYFWDGPHPVLGPVRQLGSPMRFSRTPAVRDTAGPVLGEGTREALRAAGYSDSEIDDLVARGAAALGGPEDRGTAHGGAQPEPTRTSEREDPA